jgi:hypothetical protein
MIGQVADGCSQFAGAEAATADLLFGKGGERFWYPNAAMPMDKLSFTYSVTELCI